LLASSGYVVVVVVVVCVVVYSGGRHVINQRRQKFLNIGGWSRQCARMGRQRRHEIIQS
jgi:hypothetical protein